MFEPNRSHIVSWLIFFVATFTSLYSNANLINQDESDQKAIELFDEGKFAEALAIFEKYIELYPEDKNLNYYYGACLIETQNYGNKALIALQKTNTDKSSDKLYYYLAVAYHSTEDFSNALNNYKKFEEEAKNKIRKSVNYENFMDLCKQGINPFKTEIKEESIVDAPSEIISNDTITEAKDTIQQVAEVAKDTLIATEIITEEEIPSFEIPKNLYDSLISFQVNPQIKLLSLKQFKSKEAKSEFVKGWIQKSELDSIISYTDELRNKYVSADAEKRQTIGQLILENEQKVIGLNNDIPAFDLNAHNLEQIEWKDASAEEVEKLLAENQNILDSIQKAKIEKAKQEILNSEPDTIIVPIIETPAPLIEEEPADKGVIYKIQIGAYSKTPPDWVKNLFKKLSYIRKISNYTDDRGVTVYTVGELKSFADAVEMQKQVRLEGVKDAFVAAYLDGERIKVSEARKLNGE